MLEDGSRGLVVKSGHGFYSVELDNNAGRVLKRVIELKLERDVEGLPSGACSRRRPRSECHHQ